MALATSTIIGIASLAVAAGGAYMSYRQQRAAQRNAERAADEQRKIGAEQRAQNAQRAAAERRAQIREERVRRARIMQSAENTGAAGSSGVLGALSGLSTNLNVNVGQNLGALASADRVGVASQRSADFLSAAGQNQANASLWGQASGFGSSLFKATGGYGSLFKPKPLVSLGGGITLEGAQNPVMSGRLN